MMLVEVSLCVAMMKPNTARSLVFTDIDEVEMVKHIVKTDYRSAKKLTKQKLFSLHFLN